jgi:hypothetical protein
MIFFKYNQKSNIIETNFIHKQDHIYNNYKMDLKEYPIKQK